MLRLPAVQAASPHVSVAWPFLHGEASPGGVPIGTDSAGRLFCFDPWTWMRATPAWLEAPTTLVLGRSGTSKSSLAKTYLWRLHRIQQAAGRRVEVIILDPKREYERLAVAMGLTEITLGRGGHAPINPLSSANLSERQASARALAAACLRRELNEEQEKALNAILEVLPEGGGLAELIELGLDPPAHAVNAAMPTLDKLRAEVRAPILGLCRVVDGEMADMFSSGSSLPSTSGVVVRFGEGLSEETLAIAVVAIAGWLEAILAPGQSHPRVVLVDESWATFGSVAVTSALQRIAKLGRTRGVQLILLAHRVSDFFSQAAQGTEARVKAESLLKEPEVRIIYGQPSGELDLVAQTFRLSPEEVALIATLPRARALWRIGGRSAVVDHRLLAEEVRMVDTNAEAQL